MISPHPFLSDGRYGCRTCPLPKRNTRVHIDRDALPETVDITEPARRPHALPDGRTEPRTGRAEPIRS